MRKNEVVRETRDIIRHTWEHIEKFQEDRTRKEKMFKAAVKTSQVS